MLLPRVKQQVNLNREQQLCFPLRIRCADAQSRRIPFVLQEMMPYASFEVCDKEADLTLAIVPRVSNLSEAYELLVDEGKITIRAKDYCGLVHAAATVAQSVRYKDGAFWIPQMKIFDHPDTAFRSVMLDPARNVIPVEEVRATILGMAKAKYNKLHLHLSDSTGFSYESEVCPDLPRSPGKLYTKAQLRSFIDYAKAFGIDVIPEIDIPAHSFSLTQCFPSLKCQPDEGVSAEEMSGWNICLGNEESYTFIQKILSEIAEIFPYEYVHVGTDEMDMQDIPTTPPPTADTCRCRVCNSRFIPMGYDTIRPRFYYFVRRVYDILHSLGKKMMMWNDDVDISKSPDIPRDILIEFWRVAAEGRGPVEGCSMKRFLEEGFEVVNADFPNAYVDKYVVWEKLVTWNLKKEPESSPEHAHLILGTDICAWEGQNYPHYQYALPFALPVFGDRAWNLDPLPNNASSTQALTRACLGCDVKEDFDLFTFLDGVPLGDAQDKNGEIFAKDADRTYLRNTLSDLSHLAANEAHSVRALLELL